MSYITSLGLANPPHCFHQSAIADFMVRAMQLNETDARRLKALYRATGIESRYSVLEDYGRSDGNAFYANTKNLDPFPSTKQRISLFQKYALQLSKEAVVRCLKKFPALKMEEITHLIVVSCTGMYAPGLDIDLVKALGLKSNIQRTCINFMGCYASFNALRLADSFCETDKHSKVLVICTELCSLHFQKENTEDNMLANALFADGSAALLLEGVARKGLNLRPDTFYCDLAMEGGQEMAWTVGDMGFEMKLSAYVPGIIRKGIRQLTTRLLDRISKKITDISYFAIHPGGKKILEVIEHELGLTREQNSHAYEVLRRYGNMSSPTVLFVLHEISQQLNGVDHGKKILSCAFGPGLTLESMVLSIEHI